MSVKEQNSVNAEVGALLRTLKDARSIMEARSPGKPAVELPLESVIAFKDKDGQLRAVIYVDQVIYLVDEMLRAAR